MEENNNQKKKNYWYYYFVIAVCVIISSIILLVPSINHSQGIGISELPVEKLNQGYDIVCKARDNQSVCIYNETSRTKVDPQGTLLVPDTQTNKTYTVFLYKIEPVQNNYCIKEFVVELQNQTTACEQFVGFDKNLWTISIMSDQSGKETLIEFTNGSKIT